MTAMAEVAAGELDQLARDFAGLDDLDSLLDTALDALILAWADSQLLAREAS